MHRSLACKLHDRHVTINLESVNLFRSLHSAKGISFKVSCNAIVILERTFSESNLGGLGIDWFTPVLNPPQCGILGIGRIQRVPRYSSNEIVARDLGTLVLTFDHRLIDGAPCARFLSQLRGVLEAPETLLD